MSTCADHVVYNWDAPHFSGWAKGWSRKNAWRLGNQVEADDLYQEAAVVFIGLLSKFDASRGIKAAVRLFQRATENRLIELHRTLQMRNPATAQLSAVDFKHPVSDESARDAEARASLAEALERAPAGVRSFVVSRLSGKGPASRKDAISAYAGYGSKNRGYAALNAWRYGVLAMG